MPRQPGRNARQESRALVTQAAFRQRRRIRRIHKVLTAVRQVSSPSAPNRYGRRHGGRSLWMTSPVKREL